MERLKYIEAWLTLILIGLVYIPSTKSDFGWHWETLVFANGLHTLAANTGYSNMLVVLQRQAPIRRPTKCRHPDVVQV